MGECNCKVKQMFESRDGWRARVHACLARTMTSWRDSSGPRQRQSRRPCGSAVWAVMERRPATRVLTGIWSIWPGIVNQESVVAVLATGGWFLVKDGKVKFYSRAVGATSFTCVSLGQALGERAAILEASGKECVN